VKKISRKGAETQRNPRIRSLIANSAASIRTFLETLAPSAFARFSSDQTIEPSDWVTMKLRFSIRDLLWLTLLCAVLVAWWIDRGRLQNQLDALATLKNQFNTLKKIAHTQTTNAAQLEVLADEGKRLKPQAEQLRARIKELEAKLQSSPKSDVAPPDAN
jgi:hypothetical protein